GSGCAATSPILVDPRTVPAGEMRVQAGGAVLAPIAGDSKKLAESRQTMAQPPTPGGAAGTGHDDVIRSVLPGAAIAYAMRPGFAPLARATVGLQPGLEASVRYGGRDIGLGTRWVIFEDRTEQAAAITLSLAGDVRTILRHRPEDGMLAGAITDDVQGYGGVLPLILGWQSEAGLVTGWLAALVGFDTIKARVAFPTLEPDPDAAPFRSLSAQRTFAAATVGIGLGFRSVRVGVELGIERDWISFSSDLGDAKARVWSLAPAFAIATTL
ncbi:MAG: hypothetical protein ACXWP4_08425, partial [Polyangiales bacterium]